MGEVELGGFKTLDEVYILPLRIDLLVRLAALREGAEQHNFLEGGFGDELMKLFKELPSSTL